MKNHHFGEIYWHRNIIDNSMQMIANVQMDKIPIQHTIIHTHVCMYVYSYIHVIKYTQQIYTA